MSRKLNDLEPQFYLLACQLIARCTEENIPVIIIFTGRTEQEQADLYAQGRTKPGKIVTWTLDSKHVMKAPDFKSRAIDICPYEEFKYAGPDKLLWDAENEVWNKIGAVGEKLGLKWGIIRNGQRIDLGHFEWKQQSVPNSPELGGES